jgi:hypothetical protein
VTPERTAATRLHEAEALVARLASARRLQPKMTAALGLGAPRPHEVAALEASLDAALDEYEAAWKEAHVVA